MAYLVVVTFDNTGEAQRVRDALHQAERGAHISLDDSAVVVKDAQGKVHVTNQVDRGVKIGAIGGGLLGLLIGSVFFPLGGLLLGVAGGALVGHTLELGVDQKFVKQVTQSLEPDSSAIFFIVRDADPDVAINALKPYKGTVYHTSLPTETEETLREVLSKRM